MFRSFFAFVFVSLLAVTPLKAQQIPTVLVLGDSLVAGYQLAPEMGFPEQLGRALDQAGHKVNMINAGVSGDTTAGGLARLGWALTDQVDLVIIVLGGNDALRGLDPAQTQANLSAIIEQVQARGASVVLAGMLAPRNLGDEYARAFDGLYPALAAQYDTGFYPFFLDGVAADPALNLPDGIHPTEQGIGLIVEKILPTIQKALR